MASERPSSATTVRCDRCRAEIPLRTLPPTAEHFCPFCGAPQQLDVGRLAELRRYKQDVAALEAQAQASEQQDAVWQRVADRSSSPGREVLYAVLSIFVVPTLVGLVGSVLSQIGVIPLGSPLHQGFGVAVMVAHLGGATGYIVWWRRQRLRRGDRAGGGGSVGAVGCPACGALNQVTPGEALGQCAFCGAALLPSQTVVFAGIEIARRAARDAACEAYRTERRGYLRLQRGGSQMMPLIAIGPWVLIIGVGAVFFSISMIFGDEPYNPAIFVLWALLGGAILALVLWLRLRRRRAGRWVAAASALAVQFGGGRVREGLAGIFGWLDEQWAGPHLPAHLAGGPAICGAELSLAGYPALLLCDGISAGEHHERKIHLLVAAPAAAGDQANVAGAALEAKGLTVERNQAGVVGMLGQRRVVEIARKPARLGELAATLASAAGALASGAG